ncbi:MAG TPA: RDD family protein [Kofleriaceae bacterium]|nr:RDD family protein [Kofleriaceae bacterium]
MTERRQRDAKDKLAREIVTPEGIPISFTLASVGDRAVAFVLDLGVQAIAVIVLVVVLSIASRGMDGSWLTPIAIIASFLILNFYFPFFEVRWQGSTPGKRWIGIRVIDARGGQLEAGSVLARNLVRELEVWTPMRFLLANRLLWPNAPGWALLAAGAWTFVFMLLPLFNRDKLRVGDLIGGTRVVVQPKVVLAPDLVDQAAVSMQMRQQAAPTYAFTTEQLGVYGIYELQVLEGVLRQNPKSDAYRDAVQTVADKIRGKIGYTGRVADDARFLRDFYVALRGHLEQRMLFGQRREDKYDKRA